MERADFAKVAQATTTESEDSAIGAPKLPVEYCFCKPLSGDSTGACPACPIKCPILFNRGRSPWNCRDPDSGIYALLQQAGRSYWGAFAVKMETEIKLHKSTKVSCINPTYPIQQYLPSINITLHKQHCEILIKQLKQRLCCNSQALNKIQLPVISYDSGFFTALFTLRESR